MSKIDRIFLLLVGLFGCAVVQAATIDELIAQQREAISAASAAALKKANEDKTGVGSAFPGLVDMASVPVMLNTPLAPVGSNKVDDLRLIAIYGIERNLTADIYYNGVVFSVVQGGETVDGWHAELITSSRVVLKQFIAGKKKKQKPQQKLHVMYLSDPTINMTTPNAQDGSTPAARVNGYSIPPIQNMVQR